jgi:hypothetical protein
MRTILQCAFAAISITSASGLHAAPRSATRETRQVSTASQTSPDLARMEEVIQSYMSEKKFMGCVLVARGSNVLLDKGYGFANLACSEVPLRIGYQAIHCCLNPAAAGVRKIESD